MKIPWMAQWDFLFKQSKEKDTGDGENELEAPDPASLTTSYALAMLCTTLSLSSLHSYTGDVNNSLFALLLGHAR